MAQSKRIEKWDILKFFLIFLVVLGHTIQNFTDESGWMNGLFFWMYTFHMPVFIFISGLFSKHTVNEKKYNKVILFLFLFFISKIILFLSRIIAYGTPSISLFDVGDLPWYMLAMFFFLLITIALKSFDPKYILPLIILIACVAGYDSNVGDTLAIMRVIVFYPFFYAGYCLDPQKIAEFSDKKWVKIASAVVFVVFTVLVFVKVRFLHQFKPLITGRRAFVSLGKYEKAGGALRLLYYIIVTLVGGSVVCLTPNKLTDRKIISTFGTRSLQVYMLHYVFIHFVDGRLSNVVSHIPEEVWFVPFAIIVTVICSLKIWEPIFNVIMNPEKPLAKLKKTKKD